VLAGVVLAFGAALFATRDRWLEVVTRPAQARAERAEPVALRAEETGGQFLIRWNPAAPQVRKARAASLDIADGPVRITVPIEPELLRSGLFPHIRRTEKVEVRLNLDGASETAVFAGKPPAPGAAPPVDAEALRRERDALRDELLQARTQLLNQRLLIEDLRRTVQRMQPGAGAAKPEAPPAPAAQP
jgi:hypothetical protein